MALPNLPFDAQTAPQMAELTQTFNATAALGIVPCTASGTNLITLSPNANTPTISAYGNYLQFSFVAVNSTTGAVTLKVGSLAALNVYLPDASTQATTGTIIASSFYVVSYNSALNSGAGGFVIVSAFVTGTTLTNSLAADVLLNNTGLTFTGPSVAQGTVGTWLATGTVTIEDTAGGATFVLTLTDGATIFDSALCVTNAASQAVPASLSGVIAAPTGNIRINVKDTTSTNGFIKFNLTGFSKDSTITVVRIA